ncbi:MAG: hypothetical protein ACOH2D_11390 [Gelidibacter sp.]|uniref:hypothetical protein n=1 Tax=Gelidibacter sp. TaxID=2018083 RepID=UPI0032655C02
MIIRRILIGVLIALAVLFLGFQIFELEVEATGVRALLLVFLTILYCYSVKEKRLFFLSFLIAFTIADILAFMRWQIPIVPNTQMDPVYYIANSLYIMAYSFLILQMLSAMNLVEIVKKYPFHLLILIIMDVFCVVVVTNTAMHKLSYHEYYMEFVYNSIIMILLTVSLINYIHKEDKKAINLLVGSIFIFFSEVIQLAYFYISAINLLNVMCSLFLVLAFLFFYLQSKLVYEPQENSMHQDLVV